MFATRLKTTPGTTCATSSTTTGGAVDPRRDQRAGLCAQPRIPGALDRSGDHAKGWRRDATHGPFPGPAAPELRIRGSVLEKRGVAGLSLRLPFASGRLRGPTVRLYGALPTHRPPRQIVGQPLAKLDRRQTKGGGCWHGYPCPIPVLSEVPNGVQMVQQQERRLRQEPGNPGTVRRAGRLAKNSTLLAATHGQLTLLVELNPTGLPGLR